jgi:Ala-tRNA(Pro) deacylase
MGSVTELLDQRGVPFEVIPHETTYTSIEEARALGIAADEVVKTIVLATSSGYALAVVPASRRLEMRRVHEATGDRHARLATEDELARDLPGIELGAMPPLGSLIGASTFVDPEVLEHDTIVFAASRQTESVRVRTADLFRDEPHTVAPLSHGPAPDDPVPG